MNKKIYSLCAASLALLTLLPNTRASAASGVKVFSAEAPESSYALVLAVGPRATFSRDGESFEKLKVGQALTQGAVVRSGDKTVIDIFMRRWGTTVRLTPNSDVSFDKLSKSSEPNSPNLETQLNLRAGRIFCFLRGPVANSKFEVRTPRGLSLLNSSTAGRFDIRADGSIVAGKSSFNQVKLLTENGETMVAPGQSFSAKEGHSTPVAPSDAEILIIEMDQLATLAERATVEEISAKTP